MIDEAEDAANTTEKFTTAAMRRRKPEAPKKGNGKCFNCGSRVSKFRRWCDAICRNMWQDEQEKA